MVKGLLALISSLCLIKSPLQVPGAEKPLYVVTGFILSV
jgi:hypothetical protein